MHININQLKIDINKLKTIKKIKRKLWKITMNYLTVGLRLKWIS